MMKAIEILEWRLGATKEKLRVEGVVVEAGKQRCNALRIEVDELKRALWKLKEVLE